MATAGDPKKQASLWGHATGTIAGMTTGFFVSASTLADHAANHGWVGAAGAALGALTFGLPIGWLSMKAQEQHNDNLTDIWKRLPEHPTYRDYLSDPVIQEGRAMAANGAASLRNAAVETMGQVGLAELGLGTLNRTLRNVNQQTLSNPPFMGSVIRTI